MKNNNALFGIRSKLHYFRQNVPWLAREIRNIRRGIVSDATFLVTNRCNSKCNICNIWQQTPKCDLPPEILDHVLSSGIVHPDARVLLTGGEFLLHPQCERLLDIATRYHRNVCLYTNGLSPKKIKQLVETYKIQTVLISLDGQRSTYEKVRGMDGYNKTLSCIEQLSPLTETHINFTFTKAATITDYEHVKELAYKYNAHFAGANICYALPYVTDGDENPLYVDAAQIPPEIKKGSEFARQLYLWKTGQLRAPCISIRRRLFVHPNGDIPLCGGKDLILGNLCDNSILQIWRGKKTLNIKKRHFTCNNCWAICNRPFDFNFFSTLQRIFGKGLLQALIGDYKL